MGKAAARAAGIPKEVSQLIFIAICLIAGLVPGYFAVRHWRSYQRMGSAPEQVTSAQASVLSLDDGPRWVRLTDKLQLDSDQALQQTQNGSVEFTECLAKDEADQHSFFLQFKGDTDCNAAVAHPMEGLLAQPPIYWWSKNNMPAPKFDPVELQVGYEPSTEFYECIWASLLSAMLLGLGITVLVKNRQLKAETERRAMYGGVPVPKSL